MKKANHLTKTVKDSFITIGGNSKRSKRPGLRSEGRNLVTKTKTDEQKQDHKVIHKNKVRQSLRKNNKQLNAHQAKRKQVVPKKPTHQANQEENLMPSYSEMGRAEYQPYEYPITHPQIVIPNLTPFVRSIVMLPMFQVMVPAVHNPMIVRPIPLNLYPNEGNDEVLIESHDDSKNYTCY